MRVFKDVGLVEQLGSGMSRILDKYDKSVFEISPNFLIVTLKFRQPLNIEATNDVIIDVINEKEKIILERIKYNNSITKKELNLKTGISLATIDRSIKKFRELDIIERVGSNKTGYWKIVDTEN